MTLRETTWSQKQCKYISDDVRWQASLVAQLVKDSPVGDLGVIPGFGKSPGEGKGYLLQYSGLEISMDCIVHGVTKSRAQFSNFHFFYFTSEKCLFKFFANFSVVDIWSYVCFCNRAVWVSHISWILTSYQICSLQILSPIPYVVFSLCCFLLLGRNILASHSLPLLTLLFVLLAWYSTNHCQDARQRASSLFSSSFIVSDLTFKSLIHWVNFCK